MHITGERDTVMNIKETPYFALYADIWRLHGKYIESVADDSFWDALMQDADILFKKYKDTPLRSFAESMIVTVCGEIEASYKRKINN